MTAGRHGSIVVSYEQWHERYERYCEEYHSGRMPQLRFRQRLQTLGFQREEIDAEVLLHRPP